MSTVDGPTCAGTGGRAGAAVRVREVGVWPFSLAVAHVWWHMSEGLCGVEAACALATGVRPGMR